MFADEKGYLVTQMVYEDVSNNDEVPIPSSSSEDLKKSTSKEPDGDKTKSKIKTLSKKVVSSSGTQKSMMSFFNKK
jgi:hypothetical protein